MLKSRPDPEGYGRYIDLGFQFAIAVALGTGGGYYFDKKWHSSPLFFVLGMLLGATSGFLNIYRTVFPPASNGKKKKDDHVQ